MKNNFKVALPYSHAMALAEEKGISLPEAMSLLRTWGADSVEIDVECNEARARAIAEEVQAAGLSVGAVYSFSDVGIDRFGARAELEKAAAIGSDTLVLLPFSSKAHDEVLLHAAALAERASDMGMTVAMENSFIAETLLSSPSDVEALFTKAPHAALSFKTADFFLRDLNTVSFLKEVLPKVRRVVFSDLLPDEQEYGESSNAVVDGIFYYPAPLGAGVFPSKTLRHVLRDVGFTGEVALSLYGVKSMEDAILRSLEFLGEA